MQESSFTRICRARKHRRRGEALRNEGRLDEAILELREAVRLDGSMDAHTLLGTVLMDGGLADEALSEFQTAALSDFWWDRSLQQLLQLGHAIERSGKMERALQGFREFMVNVGEERLSLLVYADPVATFLAGQRPGRRREISEECLDWLLAGQLDPPHVFANLPGSFAELNVQIL